MILNGFELDASIDEQERVFLQLASGQLSREDLVRWVDRSMVRRSPPP